MKIIQINSVLNTGSTGRITEQIGEAAITRGHASLIAHGRRRRESNSVTYGIGGPWDLLSHGVESLLLDRQGLGSRRATGRLIEWLDVEKPDAIGLHNIHGYFLNFPLFFDYLKRINIPIVWTLHDCWPFTGHCSYFDRFNCMKWEHECSNCPMTSYYPRSLVDNSTRNFGLKKRTFNGLSELVIVTPSRWLGENVARSFLSGYPVRVINNGIDLDKFRPTKDASAVNVVLGVAGTWDDRKGLADFIKLRDKLPTSFRIVLIGVTNAQKYTLPNGVDGVVRTESLEELVTWYQKAAIFVNPTYSDNFPTTNIEALACGVPVVTYDTGGSPESIDDRTGRVVPPGDISGLAAAILDLASRDRWVMAVDSRARAEKLFDKVDRFAEYVELYESLVANTYRPD